MAIKSLLIQSVILAIAIISAVKCGTNDVATPDPYMERIRSVFKAMIHNTKFKQMQTHVTQCHSDNEHKFTKVFNNTREEIKKCDGKRLNEVLPLYDDLVEQAHSFLPKGLEIIRKICLCETEECVDINMNKLSADMKTNEKLIDGKRRNILKIYEEEGNVEVEGCVIHTHSMAVLDYVMVVQDIRMCLLRKIMKL